MNWGIVGPGYIAQKFARDLRHVKGAHLRAVAGRNRKRVKEFGAKFEAERVHDNILALATDPSVDIVYIATTHNAHFEIAKLLLEHGKSLLIEKPLAVNAAQASELISISKASRLFMMEGLWSRFLPAYRQVRKWLDDGRIGKCRIVTSGFCLQGPYDPSHRLMNLELAGGGLLDLGVYNLALTRFIMGDNPESLQVMANISETGVDELLVGTLRYPENRLAQFVCGFNTHSANTMEIAGEKGCIHLPSYFHMAKSATLTVGTTVETFDGSIRGEGFEYEIEEAMRCLQSGEIESPLMPLADTLATMEVMDSIRSQIGLRYPCE